MKCRNIFASLPSANATRLQNRQFGGVLLQLWAWRRCLPTKKRSNPLLHSIRIFILFCYETNSESEKESSKEKTKNKTRETIFNYILKVITISLNNT